MTLQIPVPYQQIEAFCRKWRVSEFSIFGSATGTEFRPDSDIDVLVSFEPEAHRTLFDLVNMEEELKRLFGRPVDLVLRKSVERSDNWIRRNSILRSAQQIYVAR